MRYAPLLLLSASLAVTGCAGVDFYSDPGLTTQTGIPLYKPAKPYLLVARTGAKDKPVEVTIVYINDPKEIYYAKPKSGFGSSKLTLALANGQMTSFGQETDPKIAELLTSFSGLITANAGAGKTDAEAAAIRAATRQSLLETLQGATSPLETGQAVSALAAEMKTALQGASFVALTGAERQKIANAAQALEAAGAILQDPTKIDQAPAQLEVVKQQAKSLGELPAPVLGNDRHAALDKAQAWKAQLDKLIKDATPEAAPQATFELYEIIQVGGAVKLRPVTP